ncbi:MAG: TonB-dependent siderophore receptor [Rhodoblastus sp.]
MLGSGAAAQQAGAATRPLPSLVVTAPVVKPKARRAARPKRTQKVAVASPNVAAPKPVPASAPAPVPAPVQAVRNLGAYNPALDLPGDMQLPPDATWTTAGPVVGYHALSAMSSTKTATPVEQIPQSITVLPKALLDDQRPASLGEAVQNVSNTQGPNDLGIGNNGMSPFKIRGFAADQWLDGLPLLYGPGNRDSISNIERIEVLKGPTALLYGGGAGAAIGGAVNIVSKLPTNVASGEVGVTAGSYGQIRTFFDVNQPITPNGSVLFRVTGEYGRANSFIDVLQSKSYAFNPTITFTNQDDTTLTIQASLSKLARQAYPGLPAVGTVAGGFRINPWMWPSDPTIHDSYTRREAVTVTLDHRFDSVWSFNVKGRYSRTANIQDSQGTQTAAPDLGPTTWSVINVAMNQPQREFSINPNLRAKFALGETKNTLLIGADYSHVNDSGYMWSDFDAPPVDLLNPVFRTPFNVSPASPTFFPWYDFQGTYTTKGAYAQLQSSLWNRVHLVAGARLANITTSYYEKVPFFAGGLLPPQTFTMDKTKLLPRAGAVVDLVAGFSLYASYSEGMLWTAFTQAAKLEPEESKQLEGGLKFNLGQQFSGTISVFDIRRTNVPVVVGVGVTDTAGQRSHGYEADVVWQPTSAWKILASYGYTNAVYSDSKLAPAGNKLPGVPSHSGRVWVDYAFDGQLKGLSLGGGVYASSGQYVDNFNLYKTQSYFTIDSKLAYDAGNWTAAIHAKNITGQRYFVPYNWFGGQVAPGAPRQVTATMTYKW